MKILMLCLGNICRSPMAHGIMQKLIEEYELEWQVDSAGTGDWHLGEAPHIDSIKEANRHGIDIRMLRARQLTEDDFHSFDLILAMDEENLRNARSVAPEIYHHKLKLLMDFHPSPEITYVPDPYFEGGFDRVFSMIAEACQQLLHHYKN